MDYNTMDRYSTITKFLSLIDKTIVHTIFLVTY